MHKISKLLHYMSNEYDKIIKENIESLILSLTDQLFGIHAQRFEEIPDDLQVTVERKPDILKKVTTRDQQSFILHIEFQVAEEKDMVYRMLEYLGILMRKYKLPVRQYVIFMGEGKSKMPTQLNGFNLNYFFELKNLQDYDYENLLHSDIPEEVILAVLSSHKNQKPEEIVSQILQRIYTIVPDKIKLQRYLRQLGILSNLRNLQEETFKQIANMAFEYDIETDYLFKKGKEEGMEERNKEIAKKMKAKGHPVKEIAELTGLSIEQIKSYNNTLSVF